MRYLLQIDAFQEPQGILLHVAGYVRTLEDPPVLFLSDSATRIQATFSIYSRSGLTCSSEAQCPYPTSNPHECGRQLCGWAPVSCPNMERSSRETSAQIKYSEVSFLDRMKGKDGKLQKMVVCFSIPPSCSLNAWPGTRLSGKPEPLDHETLLPFAASRPVTIAAFKPRGFVP